MDVIRNIFITALIILLVLAFCWLIYIYPITLFIGLGVLFTIWLYSSVSEYFS